MAQRAKRDIKTSVKAVQPKKTETSKVRGQSEAFTPAEVALIEHFLINSRCPLAMRDFALFRLAIDTMLRGSDLIRLTVGDLTPGNSRPEVLTSFWLKQKKTGAPIRCELTRKTCAALHTYLMRRECLDPKELLFGISDRQYRNIIKKLALMIRLDPRRYSGHSTRRTKSKEIYAQTKNLAAVRVLLGHKSLGATAAYLGIDQEDAAAIARSVEI